MQIPEHCSWETPNPLYWTSHGYIVVRSDETGLGQSPGLFSIMSKSTIDGFFDLIEWAAEQSWSTGKVGLLGISYYAGTQWQVAARHPKGLAAIVPWEGYTDNYREACRHGGIVSDGFLRAWYWRQVAPTQYGLPGRAARGWGQDTVDGDLGEEALKANAAGIDSLLLPRFRDDPRFREANYNLEDVQVPLLSVANLGGYLLHLRGNVEGFTWAGSPLKYLRFIVGRHDLPFYYPEEVEVQRSFLDAFLRGEDRTGWATPGAVPPVDLVLRKGNPGYNNAEAEKKTFVRRTENEWPIARTRYTKTFLTPESTLVIPSEEEKQQRPDVPRPTKLSYRALGTIDSPQAVSFTTSPFEEETEVTGHIVAHLNLSVTPDQTGAIIPSDIDVFVALRHLDAQGREIYYTDTFGGPAAVTKGSLRVSLRKVKTDHPRHRAWVPYRDYFSTDVEPVIPNDVYAVDVELWPTSVVVEKGNRLVFEVSSGDTLGTAGFEHNSPTDR